MDKNTAIKKGSDKKAMLEATLEQLASDIEGLEQHIADLLAALDLSSKNVKEAKADRKSTLAKYTAEEADLQSALDSLASAIKQLKASEKPSLVQVQSLVRNLRRASDMAIALGMPSSVKTRKAISFLQQAPDVPMEDYKFHSKEIIAMLEKLEVDFRNTKTDVDAVEVKSVADFDSLIQKEADITTDLNVQLEKAKKTKSQKEKQTAEDTEDLATTSQILADDQQYLAELTQMCDDKAKTYKQRTSARADELAALTAAIDIVKTTVSEKTDSSTLRLVQQGTRVRMVKAVAASQEALEALEAEAEEVEGVPSLLQVGGAGDGARDAVIASLLKSGQKLHSSLLTSLASRIGADPFAKIKGLIQELIDRLLKEANNEANQKAFCDKSIKDAEQKRDYAASESKALNGEMAELEARRDTLADEMSVLTKELEELNERQAEAEKERAAEHAENGATVAEAEAGLGAVKQAIDILDKFYKTNAKNTVDLGLVQGPFEDAPDAGFDNGEAYKGAGGESGGIIGMLEVIQSDFERTIAETKKAEEQAAADHLAFMTETGKSLAKKEMANKLKRGQFEDTRESLSAATAGLQSQMATLSEAIGELLDLQPVCIDTGMSYDERVARREDEIESLKKALCILIAYQEYGPDGLSDAC